MQEINSEIGLKQDQTFYDLNLRLLYSLRTIDKGKTPVQSHTETNCSSVKVQRT